MFPTDRKMFESHGCAVCIIDLLRIGSWLFGRCSKIVFEFSFRIIRYPDVSSVFWSKMKMRMYRLTYCPILLFFFNAALKPKISSDAKSWTLGESGYIKKC